MDNVGPGESHGCPYRHYDADVLKASLVKSGIEAGSDDLNQILEATKSGHFQKACALQFRASHRGQELSSGITQHPNQFYQESINGGAVGSSAKANLKTEKASLYTPLEREEELKREEELNTDQNDEDQELLMELGDDF